MEAIFSINNLGNFENLSLHRSIILTFSDIIFANLWIVIIGTLNLFFFH
jgi:hypothetical protein